MSDKGKHSQHKTFWQTLVFFLALFLPAAAYSTPPERLAKLGLSEECTQEDLIAHLTDEVRRILATPPSSQVELDQRIKQLYELGFLRLKKYSKITEPQDWITSAEWTAFENFYNAVHRCHAADQSISFERLRLKLANGRTQKKSSEWQDLFELLGKCQRFLSCETGSILDDDEYNFKGMRDSRISPKGIYDPQVVEYFPDLQKSNELLKIWYHALLILWADVSTFVHIDPKVHPAPGNAPPLIDWRNLPPAGRSLASEAGHKKGSNIKFVKPPHHKKPDQKQLSGTRVQIKLRETSKSCQTDPPPTQGTSVQEEFIKQAKQTATLQAQIEAMNQTVNVHANKSILAAQAATSALSGVNALNSCVQALEKKVDSITAYLKVPRNPHQVKHVLLPGTELVKMGQQYFVYIPPQTNGTMVPLDRLIPADEANITSVKPYPPSMQTWKETSVVKLLAVQEVSTNLPPNTPVIHRVPHSMEPKDRSTIYLPMPLQPPVEKVP